MQAAIGVAAVALVLLIAWGWREIRSISRQRCSKPRNRPRLSAGNSSRRPRRKKYVRRSKPGNSGLQLLRRRRNAKQERRPRQKKSARRSKPSNSGPPAHVQAPIAPAPPTSGGAAPLPQTNTATATSPGPEPVNPEVVFWNSIKNEKNPDLFEAYLKRYPDGAFADLARIALQELKPEKPPLPPQTDDSVPIGDALLLNELRDRLYELNFDPGPLDDPLTDANRKVIRDFQQQINVLPTGIATMGLLRRLRELNGPKPWASIVFGKDTGKWGMAWDESTRKAAVARARVSCGDSSACSVEVSFFGTSCGAFAYSRASWTIMARDDIGKAKAAALADCSRHGKSCQIVASVRADGAERFSAK